MPDIVLFALASTAAVFIISVPFAGLNVLWDWYRGKLPPRPIYPP